MRPVGRPRRFFVVLATAGLAVASVAPAMAQEPVAAERFTAVPLGPTGTIVGDASKAARMPDGRISVIVELDDASVAAYAGGVKDLAATNPKARGEKSLNLKSNATKQYRAYLKGRQDAFARELKKRVKRATVTGRYDLVLNATSVVIPAGSVAAVAALPGVEAVYPDVLLQLQTDTSPSFIGATSAWQSLGGQESAGEGVIVGVLDTGIWPEHPSFSDPDPSGKAYAAPPAAPDGARACEFGNTAANPNDAPFDCNNKLIAAARVMETYDTAVGIGPGEFESARDDDGHGTHTSSTAAGNGGVAAGIYGISRGTVSGIAPRAYVETFKVCGEAGCFSSDSVAAIQAAIGDGVNVINFSISGGASPYSDAVEQAFLGAYNAGVFVAASAGNAGPGADTTDHRGPWVTTVAASTHDRAFVNSFTLTANGGASLTIAGTSLTGGVGPAPVVVAVGDQLCGPTAAGTYTGKIVVCKRGTYGRAEKGYNVLAAGGVGMILYNQSTAVTDLETDSHFLPASHVQYNDGLAVLSFLDSHVNVQATIAAGVTGSAQGDVMASFSSRGGPNQPLGVSKPDITAPGVQILAGASPQHVGVASGPQGELFQAIAGTSMSSPHIAGSGALIKALHPTWTPGQIKSALMTTARTAGLVKEDGTTPFTPFDAGSGRVDLAVAGDPGLTFDASGDDYLAYQDELFKANYPSIYVPAMPGAMTITRTARSVLGKWTKWMLTATGTGDFAISVPTNITVGAGGTASFSVKLDASAVPIGETRFGTITLKQLQSGTRVLHMPVTIVRRQAAITFTKACSPTDLAVGATTSCTLTATNPTFSDVTYSIVDKLPSKLKLDTASIVGGATQDKKVVVSKGVLPASQPPTVSLGAGSSPAGYLPLSGFGIPPINGVGDETVTNFNVPEFTYAGKTWTRIGVVSNGYVVVGGGSAPDIQYLNTNLPDVSRPNNTLAAFWTDLNPAAGGAIRVASLTDNVDTWIVVDFDAVPEYSTPGNTHSFQVWIGVNGDAHPGEDVSFPYGPNIGTGDLGFATVGVENAYGNRGNAVYYNGSGTLPAAGTELVVTSAPGATSSKVVTFNARAGDDLGSWTNCATLESSAFYGTSYSCVSGTIY